jgi:hypothetical protein
MPNLEAICRAAKSVGARSKDEIKFLLTPSGAVIEGDVTVNAFLSARLPSGGDFKQDRPGREGGLRSGLSFQFSMLCSLACGFTRPIRSLDLCRLNVPACRILGLAAMGMPLHDVGNSRGNRVVRQNIGGLCAVVKNGMINRVLNVGLHFVNLSLFDGIWALGGHGLIRWKAANPVIVVAFQNNCAASPLAGNQLA